MRILLVDTDPASRLVTAAWLDEFFAHVEIDAVSSGADALASVRKLRPDLVIAAYPMPMPDGAELTAVLKARVDPPLVVVIARSCADADFCVEQRHLQTLLLAFLQQRFPSAWAGGVSARRQRSPWLVDYRRTERRRHDFQRE